MEVRHQTNVTITHTETVQAESERRTICTINTGYFKSWQGLLKILKLIFGMACLIVAAIALRKCGVSGYSEYPLAVALCTVVTEFIWFMIYLFVANRGFAQGCKYLIIIYHIFCVILYYVAVIVIASEKCWANVYVAFGVLQLALFSMEVYFNITWLNGGPELIALPCVRAHARAAPPAP